MPAKTQIRKIWREAKNTVKGYSDAQVLVRDATSNDPWGPTSLQMDRIAEEMRRSYSYHEITEIIWKRLSDLPHPKHVAKSLILVEYLLRNGPERFVTDLSYRHGEVSRLAEYTYIKGGADIAGDVRAKASVVLRLMEDVDALRDARESARRTRGKIVGFSHVDEVPREAKEDYDPFAAWRAASPDIDYSQFAEGELEKKPKVSDMSVEQTDEQELEGVELPVKKPKKKTKKGKKVSKKSSRASSVGEEHKDPRAEAVSEGEPDFFDQELSPERGNGVASSSSAVADPFDSFMQGFSGAVVTRTLVPQELVAMEDPLWPVGTAPAAQSDALFDVLSAPTRPEEQKGDFLLTDFAEAPTVPAAATHSAPVDSWEATLKELTNLDDLEVTSDEIRWRKALEEKKSKLKSGPALKDMMPSKSVVGEGDFSVVPWAFGESASSGAVVPYGSAVAPGALVPAQGYYYPPPPHYAYATQPHPATFHW